MIEVNESSIMEQSKRAYSQWAVQWREQAKANSKWPMKSMNDFSNIGIERAILVIANGYSFEMNIDIIKKYQHNVDIMVCDKSLPHAINHGIIPTYCLVCDANVSYEKYLKPIEDKLQNTYLMMNVCGNPKWADNGNWRDKYFFVNKDVIHSEVEFSQLSGCQNFIPAGTNVSNAMIVFLTQCDERGQNNFFGYDKILTIGFDYSWFVGGKYYAFSEDGDGKKSYMKHIFLLNHDNDYAHTSTNLTFSNEWLKKYVNTFSLPVIQCSKKSIFPGRFHGDLETQMQYKPKVNNRSLVLSLIAKRNELMQKLGGVDKLLAQVSAEHRQQIMCSI